MVLTPTCTCYVKCPSVFLPCDNTEHASRSSLITEIAQHNVGHTALPTSVWPVELPIALCLSQADHGQCVLWLCSGNPERKISWGTVALGDQREVPGVHTCSRELRDRCQVRVGREPWTCSSSSMGLSLNQLFVAFSERQMCHPPHTTMKETPKAAQNPR